MGHDTYSIGGVSFSDDSDDAKPDYYETAEEPDSVSAAKGSASSYTFDNYQDDAGTTAIYSEAGQHTCSAVNYTILGLIGEAGEIANKWKKFYRDLNGVSGDEYQAFTNKLYTDLKSELGDVLWYAANLATELETTLGEVAADNYRKLSDRKSRNVLRGSGDDR